MAASGREIERLIVRLVGDATSYQRMLYDAERQSAKTASLVEKAIARIHRMGATLRSAGASMRRAGRTMSMAVTAPLAIIGGLSVGAFAQFDKAMVESTSIMEFVGDSASEAAAKIDMMRRTAIELSASGAVLQSPKELAKSYFFLASAGKSAEQSMALLPQVSAFATAGAFDMALATDLLTDAQSALGLSSKNVAKDTANLTRVGDVLIKANTLANASVRQFSIALTSKAGAALKVYKKDVEEGVAVLAAFADQGIKAELAGNALDRVIRLLSKGAIDNEKAFKRFGVDVFNEVTGNMENLGDIVGQLEVAFEGMGDKQRGAALKMMGFDARVQGVILPLLGTSDAIKQYEEKLDDAGGTMDRVARRQMEAFSNQMKILKNQITAMAIEIGGILAPIIKKLGETIKSNVDAWKGLSKSTKTTTVVIALIVAGIGPLLIVLGSMLSLVGFAISSYGALAAALHVASAAQWMMVASSIALKAAFYGLWIGGIILVTKAIYEANPAIKEFNQSMKELSDVMGRGIQRLVNMQQELMNTVNAMEGAGKKAFLEEELKRASKDMEDQTNMVGQYERSVARLEPTWKGAWQAGRAAWKMEKRELEDAQGRLEIYKDSVKFLQDELEVLNEIEGEERAAAVAESLKVLEEREAAEKSLQERVASFTSTLQQQTEMFGASSDELTLWKLSKEGASNASLEAARAFVKEKKGLEKHGKLMEEGRRLTERYLTPQEKFLKQQEDLQRWLEVGAINQMTFKLATEEAREALEKALDDLDTTVDIDFRLGVEGLAKGSAQAERFIQEFRMRAGQIPRKTVEEPERRPRPVVDNQGPRGGKQFGDFAFAFGMQETLDRLDRLVEIGEEDLEKDPLGGIEIEGGLVP